MILGIDHLVYGAPDLELGRQAIENLLGVRPVIGGQHLGRGTHNALLALGEDIYLEIIAPDPKQASVPGPLWMGVDKIKKPKLIAWAARSNDLIGLTSLAWENDISLGSISTGSRNLPNGQVLSWQLTEPNSDTTDLLVPFFINWGRSPHPAASLPSGGNLISLKAGHPEPDRVHDVMKHLGFDLPIQQRETECLMAEIQTSKGLVVLQ